MEIYGYIPITNCPDTIDKDKALFEGKLLSNGKAVGILTVRFTTEDTIPAGDTESTGGTYSRYATQSTVVELSVNENLDITSAFTIRYGSSTYNVPANTTSIINILSSVADDSDIKETINNVINDVKEVTPEDIVVPNDFDELWSNSSKIKVEDIKGIPVNNYEIPDNYPALWENYNGIQLSNGRIEVEEDISIQGIAGDKKYVWKGTLPLDNMIYIIQSNLDILMKNNRMKGDSYASTYANLFNSALNYAVDLEKSRLALLEDSRKFKEKTKIDRSLNMLGYAIDMEKTRISIWEESRKFELKTKLDKYLSLLKLKIDSLRLLTDYTNSSLDIVTKRIQTKLYHTQIQGFKANNNNKLLAAQMDGASTAFSAGMTERAPSTYNNAELMQLYTQVKTDMAVI